MAVAVAVAGEVVVGRAVGPCRSPLVHTSADIADSAVGTAATGHSIATGPFLFLNGR